MAKRQQNLQIESPDVLNFMKFNKEKQIFLLKIINLWLKGKIHHKSTFASLYVSIVLFPCISLSIVCYFTSSLTWHLKKNSRFAKPFSLCSIKRIVFNLF